MKKQQFAIRARVVGKGIWTCPDCGHQNALVLSPRSKWRVKCTYLHCHSVFRVGLVFYRQLRGQRYSGRPTDTIIGESIPESILAPDPYRKFEPVHQVREEETVGE